MELTELQRTLDELVDLISSDELLDDDIRTDLMELAGEAVGDPTPDNLRALAIVLEQISKTERYLNALAIVKGAV